MTTSKRQILSRGKGYLNAAGPQARFIVFLFGVLISYTFILMVFRKLAEIVQLPIFFPIALVVLVVFIGIVGMLYSHKFIGPLARIQKTIDHLAEGDISVSLRVRETDDTVLKDLAASVTRLGDFSRHTLALIQESARDLSGAVSALQDAVQSGAGPEAVRSRLETVREKRELLEQTLRSFKKA